MSSQSGAGAGAGAQRGAHALAVVAAHVVRASPVAMVVSHWMGRLQCDRPDRAASSMGR